MRHLLFIVIASFFGTSAFSHYNEVDYFDGSTADKLNLSRLTLQYSHGKNDLVWPYNNSEAKTSEWGLRFKSLSSNSNLIDYKDHELMATGSTKLNDQYKISYEAGANQLKQEGFVDKSFFVFGTSLEFVLSENIFGSINLGQGYEVPTIIPLSGDASDVLSQNIRTNLSYRFIKDWQLDFKYRFDILADNNQRNWFDLQAMYSISTFPSWIRVGYGSSQLNYQSNSFTYWSPRNFLSHGPRLDLNIPVFDKFHWFGGGSYNFFRENSFSPGQGHYVRTGVNYGSRDQYLIEASFENGESTQNNRLWYSHFVQLRGTIFW